jgi:hypothetical protein
MNETVAKARRVQNLFARVERLLRPRSWRRPSRCGVVGGAEARQLLMQGGAAKLGFYAESGSYAAH